MFLLNFAQTLYSPFMYFDTNELNAQLTTRKRKAISDNTLHLLVLSANDDVKLNSTNSAMGSICNIFTLLEKM